MRDARKPHHPQTFMEAKLSHIPRTRHTSDNVSRLPTEKTERKPLQLGTSPAISILSKSCSGGDLSTSLGVFTILGKLVLLIFMMLDSIMCYTHFQYLFSSLIGFQLLASIFRSRIEIKCGF